MTIHGTAAEKAIVLCEECGTAHSVWVWSDGTIDPIDQSSGCCEETEYRFPKRDSVELQ